MKLLKLKKLEKLSHMFCSELDGFHLTTYLHIELLASLGFAAWLAKNFRAA